MIEFGKKNNTTKQQTVPADPIDPAWLAAFGRVETFRGPPKHLALGISTKKVLFRVNEGKMNMMFNQFNAKTFFSKRGPRSFFKKSRHVSWHPVLGLSEPKRPSPPSGLPTSVVGSDHRSGVAPGRSGLL